MRGHAAVVFSSGAHGAGTDQTTLVESKGLEKAARPPKKLAFRDSFSSRAFPRPAGRTMSALLEY